MGYQFTGFFCDGDEAVLKAALDRWPFCVGKVMKSPFLGIGLRFPEPDEIWDSEGGDENGEDRIRSVEEDLPAFSTEFPAVTFAFVRAECFGGHCDYAGFVVRNGEVPLKIEFEDAGIKSLRLLLKPLGVRLLTGYFRPFVRGYWANV